MASINKSRSYKRHGAKHPLYADGNQSDMMEAPPPPPPPGSPHKP